MGTASPGSLITEQLATFVCQLRLETTPALVIEEAKRCILDTTGVIVAGQTTNVARKTRIHAVSAYGQGRAHVIGMPDQLHPMGTALVNGTAGHSQDFDDTSYTGIMHGSVVVLPAALAMAEQQGVNGKKLLEAFIAGVEIEYAIAELCTSNIYFKGWWTSGVYGIFGAAAASAKILGLNQADITNAIALATSYASGMRACFGTDAKPLGIGIAASRGLECALLAASAVTGPANAFESDNGFLKLMNDNKHASNYDSIHDLRLTQKWRLTDPGILFKSYPVCSAAQAGAELTLQQLNKHELTADDIQQVICEVPPLVKISLVYDQPDTIRQAQFSMPFAVGCMLAFGEIKLTHLTEDVLANPELQQQMKKVVMQVPEYLKTDDSVQQRCPEGAGITITTRSGLQFNDFLNRPTGMPGNPASTQALLDKFQDCLLHGGKKPAVVKSVADEILKIEECSNIRLIFEKLSK